MHAITKDKRNASDTVAEQLGENGSVAWLDIIAALAQRSIDAT